MITLKFVKQTGILESIWEGDIYLNQIIEYIESVSTNKDFPRRLKIVSDSRRAKFIIQPVDISKIVDANLKSLANYEMIIDAMIPANPHETAMSVLYMELSATEKYFFKIFSTTEAAIEWLKNY